MRLRVVLLLAAVLLRLIPPGWSAKAHPLDPKHVPVSAALANGGILARPQVIHLRASIAPAPGKLGAPLRYWAGTIVGQGAPVHFAPPVSDGDFTWGTPHTGRLAKGFQDSVWIEVPLQVFRTGTVSVPGPAVQLQPSGGAGGAIVTRLPTVRLLVLPSVSPTDTAATLRPLHGPLGAPWWERVPWRIVIGIALALVLGAIALRAWLARRRRPVPVHAPIVPVRPAMDPAAEALAALAALRALALPEAGRFGEHALALTRILRRYLERTLGTPRPGDTSPELIARVRQTKLAPEDVQRLEGLLGLWDRVKFARAPLDVAEAGRCETAVESLVRRRESPREVA